MRTTRMKPNGTPTCRSRLLGTSQSKILLALLVAAFPQVGVLSPQDATAQAIDDTLYTGGKARVNRSASLRTLTEAVASDSCLVNGGFSPDESRSRLSSSRQDFGRIVDALVDGDAALGMPGAEKRARTLDEIAQTTALWAPIDAAAQRLADGAGTGADAATIQDGFGDLFEQTVQLASVVSGQYSNPQQLLQSDATVLNFAVRQRALAYGMTRTMCELATTAASPEKVEALATNVALFEQTLFALRDGFPAAGINPPPNEAVAASINKTIGIWQGERAVFDTALAGQAPTGDEVAKSAELTQALSMSMNNAITLYLLASPGQDEVYRVPLEAYAKEELSNWLSDPKLIAAINAQNSLHSDLTEEGIIALDQQWRAEVGAGGGPLIETLLSSDVSGWLLGQQEATAGFVTEVFVMDNKGLNVAQSVETSDYWQGDEAKWRETYSIGPDALHISEVEFDDSTGFYQSQVSLPIQDPSTGQVIGAITFGVNVQSLL